MIEIPEAIRLRAGATMSRRTAVLILVTLTVAVVQAAAADGPWPIWAFAAASFTALIQVAAYGGEQRERAERAEVQTAGYAAALDVAKADLRKLRGLRVRATVEGRVLLDVPVEQLRMMTVERSGWDRLDAPPTSGGLNIEVGR